MLASHTSDEISPSHISALETLTAQIGNGIGRVLAEEEIRKLNQEQADIIEFLPDATFVIDRNGRVIAWNRAIAEMTGVLKEDIVGKGDYAYAEAFYGERRPILIDIIPGQDEATEARYDLVKRNRDNICGEVYIPLIYDGRGGDVWAKASLLYDTDGNVTGAIESVRDISERKQVQEELQCSEKFYRTLFESTSAPTVILGEDRTILLANSAYVKLSGYSKEDIEGDKSWTAFVVKEDLDRMREYHNLRRSDSGTAPRNYEFRFIDKSGNLHDIYLTAAMIPGTKKSVASMLDITERKQAETALYEEREQLAVTLRSIGDGVIVTNTDGNVTMLNKVAQDLTGWSEQEAFGRPLYEVFHIINEKTREVCENPVEKVLETGLVIGLANHTALIARDGTERSIADSGAPVRDKENRTIGVVLVFRDVTGEKRAEEALQQSEEHYRTLAESATDTIIRFDPRGLITYINPVAADAIKMKQEEIIGKSPTDLFPPEVAKNLKDNLMGVVRSKKSSHHEDKLPFAGQEMWYDSRVVPVMSGSGEVESVIVISRDVTDRKKAERRLKFAQFTIDNAADAIYWADDNGRFILANNTACNLYGYSREELLKMSITDLSPDFPPERYKEFWNKIKEEGAMIFEAEVTQKDGAVISVEVSVVHLSFKGHEYGCGFVRDITDRKVAERALQESEEKFRALAENSPDTIMRFDRHCRHLYVNRVVEQQTSVPAEEFIGKTHDELGFPKDLVELWEGAIENVFATEKDNHIEFKLPGGIWIDWLLVPEFSPDGEVKVVVTAGRDITDRKAAERALDVTNKKLQLLSGITRHDILNQIAALAGYTDLLDGGLPDDPEMRKYIDGITKATTAVKKQITFTRDYEHLGVDPSLWQRVGDVAGRAASGCADRNVNVSIGTGTLEIFADPMLEKVFFNLFDNAIRHGEHVTEISVTCRKEDEDGSVVIAVEDDGVGIPAEMKERIFGDGFGRHTGYGLFLAQEILAITGISIQETGEEGKGACFEIIVPNDVWRGE